MMVKWAVPLHSVLVKHSLLCSRLWPEANVVWVDKIALLTTYQAQLATITRML